MTFSGRRASTAHRVVGIVVALAALTSCGDNELAPEAAVRAWVAQSEALVEERDFRGLDRRIAADYRDARGNDRARLLAQLRAMLVGSASFETVTSIDRVEIFGEDAARVELTVRFASIDGGLRGVDVGSYRVSLELARRTKNWQVYAARWGRNERDMR